MELPILTVTLDWIPAEVHIMCPAGLIKFKEDHEDWEYHVSISQTGEVPQGELDHVILAEPISQLMQQPSADSIPPENDENGKLF